MPRGGYRKPGNPAPVSGPGKLSRRTDGGPMQGTKLAPGGKYGERKQMREMQQAAPMAATQRIPNKVNMQPAAPLPQITALTAPTMRPDEPITAGAPFGPGPGREALGPEPSSKPSDVLSQLVNFDTTGQIAELYDYLITKGM